MKKFFWLMAVLFLSANATFAQLGTNPVLEQRVERACKCTLSQAKAKPNGMRNTLQIKVRSLVQKGLMTPAQAGLVRQFSTVQSLAQGKSIATKLKAISPGNSVAAQMANGALDFIRQHEQETEAYASKSPRMRLTPFARALPRVLWWAVWPAVRRVRSLVLRLEAPLVRPLPPTTNGRMAMKAMVENVMTAEIPETAAEPMAGIPEVVETVEIANLL